MNMLGLILNVSQRFKKLIPTYATFSSLIVDGRYA